MIAVDTTILVEVLQKIKTLSTVQRSLAAVTQVCQKFCCWPDFGAKSARHVR